MEKLSSALSDTILFSDPNYPIIVKSNYSYKPYDPKHPSPIFHEELEIKLILDGVSTLMVDGVIHTACHEQPQDLRTCDGIRSL